MKTTEEEAKRIEQKMENSPTLQQKAGILTRFLKTKRYTLEQIVAAIRESYERQFPN